MHAVGIHIHASPTVPLLGYCNATLVHARQGKLLNSIFIIVQTHIYMTYRAYTHGEAVHCNREMRYASRYNKLEGCKNHHMKYD